MKKDESGRHTHTVTGSRRGGVDRAGETWHGKSSIASLFGPFPPRVPTANKIHTPSHSLPLPVFNRPLNTDFLFRAAARQGSGRPREIGQPIDESSRALEV